MQFASKRDKIIINILVILLLAAVLGIVYNVYPVFASPPTSPFYPGETNDPTTCFPGDSNCTVSPPLSTNIVATTTVTMGNNPLNFDSGTFYIDAANNLIGIGTTTPAVKLQVVDTGTQLRLGYDASNYLQIAVNASGDASVTSTGGDISFGSNLLASVNNNYNLGVLY